MKIQRPTMIVSSWSRWAGAFLVVLVGTAPALAFFPGGGGGGGGPSPVPEIDPNAMLAALGLLAGGVLMLTDRLRRDARAAKSNLQ